MTARLQSHVFLAELAAHQTFNRFTAHTVRLLRLLLGAHDFVLIEMVIWRIILRGATAHFQHLFIFSLAPRPPAATAVLFVHDPCRTAFRCVVIG